MTVLRGHEAQIAQFVTAMRSDRMPHAWLFAGPEGVGKASVARRLGLRLLAEAAGLEHEGDPLTLPDGDATEALANARAHPDFKYVEREMWEKGVSPPRLLPYDKRKDDDKPSRSIRVIQIRWLKESLTQSPSLSKRRVVIIDPADVMEKEGSNALLKSLEEPPAGTIFILVSHVPGRLLPTIRSRCRLVRFERFGDDAMTGILRESLPEAGASEIAALVGIGDGSPGRALRFAGQGIDELDKALVSIASSGDPTNVERAALAQRFVSKAAKEKYEALLARLPAFIAEQARSRDGDALGNAVFQWESARDIAAGAIRHSLDPQMIVFTLAGHVAALAPQGAVAKA